MRRRRRRKEFVWGGGSKTISGCFSIVLVTYLHKIPSPLFFPLLTRTIVLIPLFSPQEWTVTSQGKLILLLFKNKRPSLLNPSIVMTKVRIARDVIRDDIFLHNNRRNSAPTILPVFRFIYQYK